VILKRLPVIVLVLLTTRALAAEATPDDEFKKLADRVQKTAAPGQELVDSLYTFMEKFPRDPRSDQVQLWVGQVQQKRKFHNEAIKEFDFVIKDFPNSPLVTIAYRAQAASYLAIDKHDQAEGCFREIVKRKPVDFKADAGATGLFREASIWLAERLLQGKEPKVDEAIGLLMQLPDQREAVTRVVQVYVNAGRFDDAMKAIERLPDKDRLLGYELLVKLYSARPGSANLFSLLDKIIKEKPSEAIDGLVQTVVGAIGGKDQSDRLKALERVVDKYERLKRWAAFALCEAHRASDVDRLVRFVGDYRSGGDVEQSKRWIGEFYESAGDPKKAREAYQQLTDAVAAHFLVAETYYGPRAKVPDLPGGEKELSEIVKRFYSPGASCDALWRRAELQAGAMKKTDAAIATLRELIDRFGTEGDWAPRSLMRVGQLLRSQKKHDEAIVAYEQVILRYDKSPPLRQAWLEIAATYEEKREPDRAIETYKTVLRKFPRTGEASRAHTILETKYKIADTDVSDR
jgi:TolA-binding protein